MITADVARTVDPLIEVNFTSESNGPRHLANFTPDEAQHQLGQIRAIRDAIYDVDVDLASALGLDYDAVRDAYDALQAAFLQATSTCAVPSCSHHPIAHGMCAHHEDH